LDLELQKVNILNNY